MDAEQRELEAAGSWAPVVCTLPTSRQPLRVAEFDKLFGSAVRGVERHGPDQLSLELDPGEQVAATAAELVVRETSCCSFFTFTLTATGGRLTLRVSVPPNQVEVLDGLARRVTSVLGAAS
jgi:hypothetical protein